MSVEHPYPLACMPTLITKQKTRHPQKVCIYVKAPPPAQTARAYQRGERLSSAEAFKTFINRYITLHFTWRIGNTFWAAGQRTAAQEALPIRHVKCSVMYLFIKVLKASAEERG